MNLPVLPCLAHYIHDLQPYIFEINGFGPRWYGVGYLIGFAAAFFLLRYLARIEVFPLRRDQIADFVVYGCMIGVVVGGRLGYVLFYQPSLLTDFNGIWGPLRIWDGGMAAHGGILGLALFILLYARFNARRWIALGDGVCTVAPVGIFVVRCANFINGELYGRKTEVPWGVKFPTEMNSAYPDSQERTAQILHETARLDPPLNTPDAVIQAHRGGNEAVTEILSQHLPARHPSQFYEAFLEGAVLFAILWFIMVRFRPPVGVATGLFFLLYAAGRIPVELVRQPDFGVEPVLGLTRGQFLSAFMILIGAGFLTYAWLTRKQERPAAFPAGEEQTEGAKSS